MAPSRDPQVVVVGGGIAGLTTAYALQKLGVKPLILEESDALGGRVATARYGTGIQAEYGLQELWAENPALSLVRELDLPLDEEVGNAFSSVMIDGRLYPYLQNTPAEYLASLFTTVELTQWNQWQKQAAHLRTLGLTSGLNAPAIRRLQEISFSDWIQEARLGHKVSEFIRLLIECELAEAWDKFSALAGLLEFGVFLDGGATNYHIQGGNYRLIEALRDRLQGLYMTSARVLHVDRTVRTDGSILATVTYQKGRQLERVDANAVVLAIPHTRVPTISLNPPLSLTKRNAIASLGRGQYVVVHLIVDRAAERLWRVSGRTPFPIVTSGPLGVIYGMQAEGKRPAAQDVFSLLIHGQAARALHMRHHDDIVAEITAELTKLWPGFAHYSHQGYVYSYHPAAVAVWPPGRSPLDDAAQSLSEPEQGLYLAGDWLLSAHSEGAVISGQRAAQRVARVVQSSR